MELRQLASFVAVAESGRVSSAALRCNLTQGAVSQQIRLLEEEFGIPLFVRTKKEMCLTDAGLLLLEHARMLLSQAQTCKDDISAINGKLRGELRIGAGSFIEPFLGPVIGEFMNRYPEVHVISQYDYAHVLNRLLRNNELDIAFSINKSYAAEGIQSVPCFRFNLQAIMQDKHPLAKRKTITFSDIINYRLMLPDIGARENDTLQQYASEDIRPMLSAAVGNTNNTHALISSVKHLGVITMLPPEYVILRKDIIAKPVKSMERKFVCYRHTMANVPIKATVSAFLDMVLSNELLDIVHPLQKE